MKLATFRTAGTVSRGVIEGDTVIDVGAVLSASLPDLRAMIANDATDAVKQALPAAPRLPAAGVEWLPVITEPGKILCVGLNYETHRKETHRKETGRTEVANPTIFARFANSQTGHLHPIPRPRVPEQLDFEGELAVIIGKPGRYIAEADAMDHVAGCACHNDGSVRDFQYHTHQFTPGKNFPDTGAFGPWMVTPDEMGPLGEQRLQTRVNGQVVQDATLSQMIFDVPTQIAYCSSFTGLEPGDMIVTGTPGGVGAKRTPPLWLKPGDTVEVEIDRVGLLRNPVTQAA